MDLSIRKYKLIEKIINLDKLALDNLENLINQVAPVSKKPSVQDYNQDIKEAYDRIDKGAFYTQEEVLKMTELW